MSTIPGGHPAVADGTSRDVPCRKVIDMTGPYEMMAAAVARRAHEGVLNKHSGEPYILHPERVVEHLRRFGATDSVLAIAWLHDVVEDTGMTLDDLRNLGLSERIVAGVDAISCRPGEARKDYYQRVGANLDALMVKLSDLRDNTDPTRRAGLSDSTAARLDRKYQTAHRELIPWIHYHRFKETA